ncbi:MAG: hypothetical protein HETSPECPRED_001460 [Heterodermia speciosa]|uniref:Uncharacterized protein n=1 Tax=Heterodermia speciosa TaxID=116794 RepID=A0A8H3J1L4_9LECA|nr:MAG: hypothetical protein HETSPECPRED_001460 [Heterodermia speciosa]
MYRRIGSGFCGTVWAADQGSSDTTAIKREDGGPGRSLHNDYTMHKEILYHLVPSIPHLRIPVCHQYLSRQDPLWDELTLKFPQPFQVPCNSLITERIPPFPQEVRERIIDEYCPNELKASIKSSEPDRDCLVRPYLGRRRLPPRTSETSGKTRFQPFSLRNYPLHIDRIEDLGLDSTLYAKIMAHTLANIYWKANIDANDIEFVLASPSSNAPSSDIIRSKFLGVKLGQSQPIEAA